MYHFPWWIEWCRQWQGKYRRVYKSNETGAPAIIMFITVSPIVHRLYSLLRRQQRLILFISNVALTFDPFLLLLLFERRIEEEVLKEALKGG